MNRALEALLVLLAAVPACVVYAALLGLGLHRHAHPIAISLSATFLLFAPPLVASAVARDRRVLVFGSMLLAWSAGLFLPLSVYFPGERNDAVATGIALLAFGESWDDMARAVADRLPEDRQVSDPEVPEASTMAAQVTERPSDPLENNQIALPFDGEGRRLSVPVVFENAGRTRELYMMLDTGATYTTLAESTLEELGVELSDDDPVIKLHTANGEREARIVLLDKVWLGDLYVEGAAIATCTDCASSDTAGLLGLNVAGGFNMMIDADRREVVFTQRGDHNQRLDIKPFAHLTATFTRYPGGRVEVEVELDNRSHREVGRAVASIACGEQTWRVEVDGVEPGETSKARRRLPSHKACKGYEVALHEASW